ncbi:MAG: amidophosphoribosyltransferase [Deltaproteobacteria bacterium]|nr:amidophosphoribosyltransferase [Candidatus Anaeroferrophillus wilburensis]MBN2887754.1 amidophosphoribosyltransferase [Deltaproteobacteria bacterium]
MCGIIGIFNHPEASNLAYLGLYAMQHRGQESAGIISTDGSQFAIHKGMGLVADIFSEETIANLPGNRAIGHVRYSTAGASSLENAQPFMINFSLGTLAIAHNGNLVNAEELKRSLVNTGSIFQSSMDSEVVMHLIACSREPKLIGRLADSLKQVKGAYSLLFLNEHQMIAARDPRAIRPLVLGKLKGAYIVASETCAFDLLEAEFVREIAPGEILTISDRGIKSYFPFPLAKTAHCIFEYIYFARPDSIMFGETVYDVRIRLGRQLAREHPVEADMIIPIPDSGTPAALGYAKETGIPFELGLIRNHYVGRTFIEPQSSIRHFGVKIKLNAIKSIIKDKRVIVIDDSIVRGTTSRKIIKMIKAAGAREVHVRISSPPTDYPCFYGIDTPSRGELIASSHTVEDIRKYITADSLGYISTEGLRQVVRCQECFCDACFSGHYPVSFPAIEEPEQPALF